MLSPGPVSLSGDPNEVCDDVPSDFGIAVSDSDQLGTTVDSLFQLAISVSRNAVEDAAALGLLLQASIPHRYSEPTDLGATVEDESECPSNPSENVPFNPGSFSMDVSWKLHAIRDAVRYLADISDLISKTSETTKRRLDALEVSVAVCESEIDFATQKLRDVENTPLEHLEQLWSQLDLIAESKQLVPTEIAKLLHTESRMRQERLDLLKELQEKAARVDVQVNEARGREAKLLKAVEPIVENFEQILQTLKP
eukprot:Gregarina_sp_Poly_1__1219@NODE_129_length_13257_cov_57_196588_g115_i0_p8_GENE_NODE_129_length_13257_cov_57_196588_g115_i0NODE_129_length_13257_cov_57_196588_g115_i0_p8_ORF_typecomplete_len254_score45_82DUF3584/PF12128_8/0_015Rogdi_lz/PF10259_9/0_029Muted/PF14942_6/0_16Mis14/PF08641_12/0_28DUF4482/PF14818_6/1_7e04DUF4482/PF14818_6/0_35FlaC_arch/PF05377_11/1_3e02FlaC_arch/PF05377_11/4_5Yuri_gagarin/PF15934_5/0_94Myosin_tail_1/PF01576_19/1_6_NODE_129_length_13257_cov_57_196588_g115_i01120211963